jgi:hypothetical protein
MSDPRITPVNLEDHQRSSLPVSDCEEWRNRHLPDNLSGFPRTDNTPPLGVSVRRPVRKTSDRSDRSKNLSLLLRT